MSPDAGLRSLSAAARGKIAWAREVHNVTSSRFTPPMGKLKRKMCEGCGLKQANYGLASEAKRRWCAGCMKTKEAVPLQKQKKMCEGCGLKHPTYGLASEGKARWCAGCGAAEGAVSLQKQKMCEGCGLKHPTYGLASEGKKRWCLGCGKAKGAVCLCRSRRCNYCGMVNIQVLRKRQAVRVKMGSAALSSLYHRTSILYHSHWHIWCLDV
jgi:hypothetical protein